MCLLYVGSSPVGGFQPALSSVVLLILMLDNFGWIGVGIVAPAAMPSGI